MESCWSGDYEPQVVSQSHPKRRKQWAIENQLHWSMDIIFDEDSSRARKDFSPLNLNVLRKTARTLCKHADFGPRVSMKKKRFAAALDPDHFLKILSAKL